MIRFVAVFVAMLVIVSCGTPNFNWYHPYKHNGDFTVERRHCEEQAAITRSDLGWAKRFTACMQRFGWRLYQWKPTQTSE
jgi:hypothetical protein